MIKKTWLNQEDVPETEEEDIESPVPEPATDKPEDDEEGSEE